MNIYAITALIGSTSSLILGIFVCFKNKNRPVNRYFGLLSLSIFIWVFGCFMESSVTTQSSALFWDKFLYTGAAFAPTLFLHFSLVFTEKKRKKILITLYSLSIIFLFLNLLPNLRPLFIEDVQHNFPFRFIAVPGPIWYLYLLYFAFCGLYPFYILTKTLKEETSGHKREQLKYLFLSLAVIFIAASMYLSLVLTIAAPPIDNLLVAAFSAITAYAIVKHRLLDINIALTRAGIFAFVYLLVLGIPLGLTGWGKYWLQGLFGSNWYWAPVVLAIILATAGPFIYQRLRRRAEDAVLKDQRRYQNILRQLSATMTLIKDLDRLLKIIVYRTARAVKVNFACVYLADDVQNKLVQRNPYTKIGFFPNLPKELSYNSGVISFIKEKYNPIFAEELTARIKKEFNLRSGLIVPSFMREKLLGFLLLGPKSSGAIYTQDDVNAFEVLANQASLAIENTEFIAEFQRTQSRLFATERMTSLGTMAGGMSHQLNNRFHAIIMATSDTIDTLKLVNLENASKEELKDYLKQITHALTRIQENAKLGGKIVNNFLNFSQPDRIQKEAKSFSLREPLEQAIEMVRIKTSLSEDMIERDIQEDLPQIQGDFVLLQDVFFNLIDNATDALSRKDKAIKDKELPRPSEYKGKIVIRMFKSDSNITVQIRDNGIGMPEEVRKRLFVPFFTTKATSAKGTGLGLFVIQKIINVHQGQIQVSSEYGQGTTFTINLPINK
ncbi:MAG: hypothetical protein DRP74_06245 [Candidatus Omnitrophota bacterium]|nr:MAG: hypothetical protein DRP74_06245 [Candidatus Omnitrophota bacterium]